MNKRSTRIDTSYGLGRPVARARCYVRWRHFAPDFLIKNGQGEKTLGGCIQSACGMDARKAAVLFLKKRTKKLFSLWFGGSHKRWTTPNHRRQSFLVLFFKKELLASFNRPHSPAKALIPGRVQHHINAIMTTSRQIVATVVTLARLIRTAADKRARAHGMTRAQWQILIHLDRQPGLVQKELAEILEVEPITVARLVDRLEARGMVERRSDPMDRRCWRLHLTDSSRPLMGEIDSQLDELAHTLCQNMDAGTLEIVAACLETMRDAMGAEARSAPCDLDLEDVEG
jgi:MarR family transcriptional regulator for hemolysin